MKDHMLRVIIPFAIFGAALLFIADQIKTDSPTLSHDFQIIALSSYGVIAFLVILREVLYFIQWLKNKKRLPTKK